MNKFYNILFLMLLVSCAHTPPSLEKTRPTSCNFQASGVLSLRGPKLGENLHWEWQQQGAFYALTLRSPLGVGALHLSGTPGHILLKKPDGQQISSKDPNQLLFQETGWKLPVSNLYYWLRALPIPHAPAQKKYDGNQLLELQQQGWTVVYSEYHAIKNCHLPTKILLTNNTFAIKIITQTLESA